MMSSLFGLRRKPRMSQADYEEKITAKGLTPDGRREVPSDEVMAPPVGYVKAPSMVDHIRAMVRSEKLRAEAEAAGAETFEEADDFDVEDDPAPVGTSEMFEPQFEPPAPAPEVPKAPARKAPEPPSDGPGAAADAGETDGSPAEPAPAKAPAKASKTP